MMRGPTLSLGKYSDFTRYCPVNPPVPQPIVNKEHWQPQLVNHTPQTFLTAHWGLVKPFALTWVGQFRPIAPENCGKQGYKQQAEEVLEYSANLTDKQKIIAEYCAGMHEDRFEDTPKMVRQEIRLLWSRSNRPLQRPTATYVS